MGEYYKIELYKGKARPREDARPLMSGYIMITDEKFHGYVDDFELIKRYKRMMPKGKSWSSVPMARRYVAGHYEGNEVELYIGVEGNGLFEKGLYGFVGTWPIGSGELKEFEDTTYLRKGRSESKGAFANFTEIIEKKELAKVRIRFNKLIDQDEAVHALWLLDDYTPLKKKKSPPKEPAD